MPVGVTCCQYNYDDSGDETSDEAVCRLQGWDCRDGSGDSSRGYCKIYLCKIIFENELSFVQGGQKDTQGEDI